MDKIKSFMKTSLLGGIVVILPVAISFFVFKWIFIKVTDIIQTPTNWLMTYAPFIQDKEFAADALVIITILLSCFIIGIVVRTHFGKIIYKTIDAYLAKILPAYSMIKEIVSQFFGDKKSPFSNVALVRIFDSDALMTAFVTETHENGLCTVFVPTGPNPTSGNIYHLKPEFVHYVDVGVEEAMKSIIGCGAGSAGLITSYSRNRI
jgi:uncharacterized membrane protein